MNEVKKKSQNTKYLIQTLTLKPGITLVELVTGLAILAVISLMVASVYLAHFRLFSTQNTNIDIATQNSLAIDEMANQIREAEKVTACIPVWCVPSSGFVISPVQVSTSTKLIIKIWPIDASGNPIQPVDDSQYDYITYRLTDTGSGTYDLIKDTAHDDINSPSTRTEGTKIIASNVALPDPPDKLFKYFDTENQELIPSTNDLTKTATVVITLTTKGKALDRPDQFYTQSRKVLLRNK